MKIIRNFSILKLKNLTVLFFISLLSFSVAPQMALAGPFDSSSSKNAACQGIAVDGSNACTGNSGSTVGGIISAVINIMSVIIGVLAVIMIIVAGFKFITSAGDAQKAASARSTLIYAIVGLVVAAMAQVLVHFVLTKAAGN